MRSGPHPSTPFTRWAGPGSREPPEEDSVGGVAWFCVSRPCASSRSLNRSQADLLQHRAADGGGRPVTPRWETRQHTSYTTGRHDWGHNGADVEESCETPRWEVSATPSWTPPPTPQKARAGGGRLQAVNPLTELRAPDRPPTITTSRGFLPRQC
ncbi:unnamed protein product [Boreogadus saida]